MTSTNAIPHGFLFKVVTAFAIALKHGRIIETVIKNMHVFKFSSLLRVSIAIFE